MAEEMGEKTETATARRRSEARKNGSIPRSTDLTAAISLSGALLAVILLTPSVMQGWFGAMHHLVGDTLTPASFSEESLLHELTFALVLACRIAGPFLAIMAVTAIVGNYVQVGWLITLKPLQPDLTRLDPVKGLKKFVGLKKLVQTGMSMAKVGLMVLVVVIFVRVRWNVLMMLPLLESSEAVHRAGSLLIELCWWLIPLLLVLGIIDYLYQRWQWERDNRMSKQEIKEEMKMTMGDPTVRKRQRKFAMDILSQRLHAEVPTADVVVTNPEHLAIALKYDPKTMNAPRVVAKGADYVALRIRQIAAANGVPILERKPLARAMYPLVEVGREIPGRFYAAVAEILAYVYRLSGDRKAA